MLLECCRYGWGQEFGLIWYTGLIEKLDKIGRRLTLMCSRLFDGLLRTACSVLPLIYLSVHIERSGISLNTGTLHWRCWRVWLAFWLGPPHTGAVPPRDIFTVLFTDEQCKDTLISSRQRFSREGISERVVQYFSPEEMCQALSRGGEKDYGYPLSCREFSHTTVDVALFQSDLHHWSISYYRELWWRYSLWCGELYVDVLFNFAHFVIEPWCDRKWVSPGNKLLEELLYCILNDPKIFNLFNLRISNVFVEMHMATVWAQDESPKHDLGCELNSVILMTLILSCRGKLIKSLPFKTAGCCLHGIQSFYK